MDTVKIKSGKTKIIAHRGLSGIELENTNAAFVAAGNRSYFGIETDIHRSADGEFVIIHDDNTRRVSGVELEVERSLYSDLRAVRLKDKNGSERSDLCIPLLHEYLRIAATYSKIAVLELKGKMEKDDIVKILATVEKEYTLESMIFISFELSNLISLRNISDKAKIQYLAYGDITDELIDTLVQYDFGLDHCYKDIAKSDISRLHKKGIEVNCWTVDDSVAAEQLVSWGVDYITSNILE